jgi:hypothetical protein
MDIQNYTSFFHDGSIMEISHAGNKMTFSMESAEIDEEDVKGDVVLSKNDRIRGKLHLEKINDVKEDGQSYSGVLTMKYEDAEIFHFEINQNSVEFQIKWNSYPPKPCIENFSTIEIKAEKIWWENIPDLAV